MGMGVVITTSANVYLKNNIVYDFKRVGVNVITSSNITLDGNVVIGVA